jgi:hypothetical protein
VGIQNGVISLFDYQRVFLLLLWFATKKHASVLFLLQLAFYVLCGPQLVSGRFIMYVGLLLAFLVLLQACFYFYFFLQVKQMEMLWNKSKIQRLKKAADAWVDIKISELKVGDLILLNYNTVCPADILVLDTSETHFSEKILSTNERRISGANHSTIKVSIRNLNPVTKGRNTPLDALKVIAPKLDGYIEYESPSDRVNEFSGIFKLNNDPKVGLISHKNMVFCGTKLLADWTIGIILYTGKNTKVMQMNKSEESFLRTLSKEAKLSKVGSLLNDFVLILTLVALVVSAISVMLKGMFSHSTEQPTQAVLLFYSNNVSWIAQGPRRPVHDSQTPDTDSASGLHHLRVRLLLLRSEHRKEEPVESDREEVQVEVRRKEEQLFRTKRKQEEVDETGQEVRKEKDGARERRHRFRAKGGVGGRVFESRAADGPQIQVSD